MKLLASPIRFFFFPFFSIHLVSSLSLCVASFTLMGCLTYTSHGCANAKYVGRNFLFVQRFSDTLPAFGGATTVHSRLERRRQRGTERCLWETFLALRHVSNHCVSSMLLRCRVKIFRLNFQLFLVFTLFSSFLLFIFFYILLYLIRLCCFDEVGLRPQIIRTLLENK